MVQDYVHQVSQHLTLLNHNIVYKVAMKLTYLHLTNLLQAMGKILCCPIQGPTTTRLFCLRQWRAVDLIWYGECRSSQFCILRGKDTEALYLPSCSRIQKRPTSYRIWRGRRPAGRWREVSFLISYLFPGEYDCMRDSTNTKERRKVQWSAGLSFSNARIYWDFQDR